MSNTKNLPKETDFYLMSDLEIQETILCLDAGIIPFCRNSDELREALATLNKVDRRIAKRKFRKAWRKLRKKNRQHRGSLFPSKEKEKGRPGFNTMSRRRQAVLSEINKKARKVVDDG